MTSSNKPPKKGIKVRFQYCEPVDLMGTGFVAREAIGEFTRVDHGGMWVCTLEGSNIEVIAVPWAVKRLYKRRKRK